VTIVVVGDALLDRDVYGSVERLSPDAPVPVFDYETEVSRPGGAGLAAALAARDGQEVRLVTALATDSAGRALRAALERAAVEVIDLGLDGPTPEKARFFAGEHQLLRVDRGDRSSAVGPPTAGARAALSWADAVLVADYGRGVAATAGVRETLADLCSLVPVVWDPHPHGPPPVAMVTVATPNESELKLATEGGEAELEAAEVAARAEALRANWSAGAVCVTRGSKGALFSAPGRAPVAIPAEPVRRGDPCGAGDRFSSRLTAGLAQGLELADAASDAVAAASIFVGAGGARAFGERPMGAGGARAFGERPQLRTGDGYTHPPAPDPFALAREVRAAGGTVVATGGCFDLLHAGHVSTLMAARALGDCLIVCVNSDRSVRRLKGAGRPVVAESERSALLSALGCVDAVVVFDEDTPGTVLRRLRPHVWAKGGDYRAVEMPEARVVEEGGGRVIVLPFLDGYSTTRLIEEAASGA
jgi:rfaE bifunctional protein nucleotidyltransferase chain/domain/rfaE bifunctional protein kinase chain/domain